MNKVTISTIGKYREIAKNQKNWHPEKATVRKIDIFMQCISQRGSYRFDSGITCINYVKKTFTHGVRLD